MTITIPTDSSTPSAVTVLGLGAMGRALATAFLDAGHATTVWNRSPGRADDLEAAGATVAPSVGEAVAASRLTVVCVLDSAAVEAVLDTAGDALSGATIVNLTSSTPDDARALARRIQQGGAHYVDGKIMVPTPLIGTDDGFVIYSGDRSVFNEHVTTLRALGPEADLLGDDHGLAALYDLGMLDIFFNGMAAFLHAAALVGADGVPAGTFLSYASRIISVLQATMPALADEVDRGQHPGDEDNLDMEGVALDHIIHASAARGIDTSAPQMVRSLVGAAIDAGHGRDGFSRVIDILRQPVPTPTA